MSWGGGSWEGGGRERVGKGVEGERVGEGVEGESIGDGEVLLNIQDLYSPTPLPFNQTMDSYETATCSHSCGVVLLRVFGPVCSGDDRGDRHHVMGRVPTSSCV